MFLHNGERDLWCNTPDETSHESIKTYEKKQTAMMTKRTIIQN